MTLSISTKPFELSRRKALVLSSWALAAAALLVAITTLSTQAANQLLNEDFNIHHYHHRLLDEDQTLLNDDMILPPIFPFRWPQDYLAFGCAILGLLLAAGGGIGGGGILVAIYILLLEFPLKHAIPLASVTVLGGAIANNALNIHKVNPDHIERPAIDWDLILLLQPATIAGALIGADLNEELPDIALLVLMLLLLTVTAYKTLEKACSMYRDENEIIEANRQVESEFALHSKETLSPQSVAHFEDSFTHYDLREDSFTHYNLEPKVVENYGEIIMEEGHKNEIDDIEATNKQNSSFEESERMAIKHQCIKAAIKLISLFSVVTILDILQGSVIDCGANCYMISQAFILLCIVLFSMYVRHSILQRQNELGGPIISEIHWDNSNTVIYPSLSIIAGLVAGMFGIGGGIIKGPLMLQLGVHPQVVSATSACMILFTSSTSTICFLISGYLVYDYAAFCLVLGFLSTLVGQTAMSALLKSSGKRNSYIAFCIGGVVAVSAVAMGIESAIAIF